MSLTLQPPASLPRPSGNKSAVSAAGDGSNVDGIFNARISTFFQALVTTVVVVDNGSLVWLDGWNCQR